MPKEWATAGRGKDGDVQSKLGRDAVGADVLFLLVGAVLVFAMHGGFAFLEAGTVRHKNQVNALCKILVDFAISTVAYFLVGFTIAYGVTFFLSAPAISGGAAGLRRAWAYPGALLLPVHVRRGRSSDRLGGHRRARQVPSAVRRDGPDRRPLLSLLRRHRLEQELRPAGRASSKPGSAPSFTISPDRSSCTRSAAGSASPPFVSSARVSDAMSRAV